MKKILTVEDGSHVVSFIRKGLSEEGFEVSVAHRPCENRPPNDAATFTRPCYRP